MTDIKLDHPNIPQQVIIDAKGRKQVRTVYSVETGEDGRVWRGVVMMGGRKRVLYEGPDLWRLERP